MTIQGGSFMDTLKERTHIEIDRTAFLMSWVDVRKKEEGFNWVDVQNNPTRNIIQTARLRTLVGMFELCKRPRNLRAKPTVTCQVLPVVMQIYCLCQRWLFLRVTRLVFMVY